MKPLKIYIAAPYPRREEMEEYAKLLEASGFTITSGWVYGGEEGLDEEAIAELDLSDIDDADMILLFTYPIGTWFKSGGRMVEFGYAIGQGKQLAIIGERENVFCYLPDISVYPSLAQFITAHQ